MENLKTLSGGALAFVGDAVYGLLVRERLSKVNRPIGDLHTESVKYVNANAQAEAYEIIKNLLTEEEQRQFKHGRNVHTSRVPKKSSIAQYHTATGIEALFGYLYMSENKKRMNELFEIIWKNQSEEILNIAD